MSEGRTRTDHMTKSIFIEAEFGGELEMHQLLEAVREKVVNKLVSMYVEAFGDEIIASIDLETVKKKTNEQVTVKAIKELIK